MMMTSLTSIILALILSVTSVFASAQIPDFLTEQLTNYTADYTVSISFDNSEEVAELLNEIEIPEEVSYYVDMEALLRTLLTFDEKMYLQSDISDDYQKIKLGLTAESSHNININPNLDIGVNSKMGMWMNMDLSNETTPVFDLIYSYPFLNKYMKMDGEDIFAEAGSLDMFKALFNKEYLDSLQSMYADLYMKYATIENSGNKYIVKMNNDAFAAYVSEIILMMPTILASMMPEGEYDSYLEMPSVEDWQFLGEDGLECEFVLSGGKLKTEKVKLDISVDIAEIFTAVTGEEWPYESDGKIDFTIAVDADISNIGKTKVEFPVLTEENSFTFEDMGHEYITEEEADYAEYPLWYVGEYCEYLPVVDGQVYVPLRQTINAAFEDSATIDYDNGVITMTSDYFNDYKTMVISIDSTIAKLDGVEHHIMKPVLIDGKTYVSNTVFNDIFGWELSYASHELVTDEYYYTFHTYPY